MKVLRIAVLSLFLLSSIAYLGYWRYISINTDLIGPEIRCDTEEVQVSVKATEEELLQGITAFDDKDKDVTGTLLIESISDFISPGKRIITYAAFDSSNNVSRLERKLIYTDYTSPQFTILQPLRFALGSADGVEGYLQVLDCLDGDITDKIKFDQLSYNYYGSGGVYSIEFRATNSAGDTAYLSTDVEFY